MDTVRNKRVMNTVRNKRVVNRVRNKRVMNRVRNKRVMNSVRNKRAMNRVTNKRAVNKVTNKRAMNRATNKRAMNKAKRKERPKRCVLLHSSHVYPSLYPSVLLRKAQEAPQARAPPGRTRAAARSESSDPSESSDREPPDSPRPRFGVAAQEKAPKLRPANLKGTANRESESLATRDWFGTASRGAGGGSERSPGHCASALGPAGRAGGGAEETACPARPRPGPALAAARRRHRELE